MTGEGAQHRKIIHVDMDAFYAAVEQRDNPDLRGKAIAVGGSSGRGVVMTASYEARRFGVRSALPSVIAKRLCPDLIFVKSNMDKYRAVSDEIRSIFADYTDLVEPLSLDEAYLDVTENRKNQSYASKIADEIRMRIFEATGLTASAGVSYNKFLAKIASDYQKPNGRTVIRPDQALAFLDTLPIEKFHGVGKVTAEKMRALGIVDGAALRKVELEKLVARFGKAGTYYFNAVRGVDDREVKPNRIRKSVGAERTFFDDKNSHEQLQPELDTVTERIWERLKNVERPSFTLTLKLKTSDFKIINRSVTSPAAFDNKGHIQKEAYQLLKGLDLANAAFRLIGLKLSNFQDMKEKTAGQKDFGF